MNFTQFPGRLNRIAILQAMKPDERIVCTNATVVMDSNGEISYFNNDNPIFFLCENENKS